MIPLQIVHENVGEFFFNVITVSVKALLVIKMLTLSLCFNSCMCIEYPLGVRSCDIILALATTATGGGDSESSKWTCYQSAPSSPTVPAIHAFYHSHILRLSGSLRDIVSELCKVHNC